MPRLGGVELLKRAHEIKPTQPFVLVIGEDRHLVLDDIITLENCAVLNKPLDFFELRAVLCDLLQIELDAPLKISFRKATPKAHCVPRLTRRLTFWYTEEAVPRLFGILTCLVA